jgi:hypothetical protein
MTRNHRPDHWHVFVGMNGYVPDASYAYETRKDAESSAQWEKEGYAEAYAEEDPPVTITGNKRNGYVIDRGGHTLPIFISIEPCNEEHCRDESGELIQE